MHRSEIAREAREARDRLSPFFSPPSRLFEKFFRRRLSEGRKGRGCRITRFTRHTRRHTVEMRYARG